MDTHAVYEGAMRLLAARQGASVRTNIDGYPRIIDASESDIANVVDLAARTWEAAHKATEAYVRRRVGLDQEAK